MTVTTGNDRRADAVGNGSLLVFAYDFLILANTDIKVYHVDAAGLSTLLTLTTDYTVSGVGTSGGGNITLTSAYAVAGTPAATESILMLGETAKTQETDLLQNGAYNAEVQEAIGDKLTLIANEHERERDRSLRLALSDSAVTVSTLLPVVVGNTTIAWNAAGTALVEGPTVTAISGAAASATAAAASATAASASASTSSTNAAATAADLVATNQDTIDTAADLVQTAADVLLTAADVVTIAGSTASTSADVVLTHADVVLTNADVVSTTADAVATAADLVQTNIDQLAVAADLVATNQDTIDTAADLVATNQDTIDTAADLVQTNLDQISAAASAVATAADLVLTNADQISAAANAAITAQDAIDTAADAVATAADLVLTDADQVSAAASAAAAAASYDLFDDRYLGSKSSAPTVDNDGNALITGALYFNSTTDILYVRNSASAWQSASSSISTTFQRFEYTAGGGETSFTGADDNSNTLSYDSGFEYTFLNGVLLNDGDYTSTTGTSVTGLTALTAGDKLEIIAHGTATPGDFYTKAAADAKYELIGAVDLTAPGPIGGTTPGSGSFTDVSLSDTDAGAAVGPILTLYRNSASPGHDDVMGGVNFDGETSTSAQLTYASIRGGGSGVTNGSSRGTLTFHTDAGGGGLTERMRIDDDGKLMIGETENANMTLGLTINQGTSDDEILTLKSSDVAHAMTSYIETDSFYTIAKSSGPNGGARVRVFRENSGSGEGVLLTQVLGSPTLTTTKSTVNWNSGMEFNYFGHDGSDAITDVNANGNVFAVKVSKASGTKYIFGIDEDGDIYQDGTTNNVFDAWDDAVLLRGLQLQQSEDHAGRNTLELKDQLIKSRFDGNRYTKEDLQAAKLIEVVSDESWDADGERSLINETVRGYLQTGAIWQNHEMLDALMEAMETALKSVGVNDFQKDYVRPRFVERGLPTQILDWTGTIPTDVTVPDIAPKAFNA